MIKFPFFQMIQHLREKESVLLFGKLQAISEEELSAVAEFLSQEYQCEALDYPFQPPDFDDNAAIWSAQTIYLAAQLMLYREHRTENLLTLFPIYEQAISPAQILSVDLLFRFLPAIILHLKMIDDEDELITILEQKLKTWHYSGINYPMDIEIADFQAINANQCLQQLYCNRIIQYQNLKLAKLVQFSSTIKANLGIFNEYFWKELNPNLHESE
jgi:hypothetical protein